MIKIQMVSGKSVFIENATRDDYDYIMDNIFYNHEPHQIIDDHTFVLVRNIEVVEYIEQKGTV